MQVLTAASQMGVAPPQPSSLLAVHWTHWPSSRQAGLAGSLAAHWASLSQGEQTWSMQMGVPGPPHSSSP
ncbi:MAG: hypothetical protein IPN32_22295 [Deltaproteobacteria bacterium]|nr:hypothetical protein [Deltaproteobacteria bacterium]